MTKFTCEAEYDKRYIDILFNQSTTSWVKKVDMGEDIKKCLCMNAWLTLSIFKTSAFDDLILASA